MMTRTLRIAFALGLVCLCLQAVALPQSIPPGLHARILQLEDERNLNGDELAKLLKHASPKVRERAALAIGRIGDKRGTAALIELLQNEKDEQVRAMAAFALGEMEDAQAVPALMVSLEAGKHPLTVRARAAEALGKIIPPNNQLLGQVTIEQINTRLIEQLPDPKASLTADEKLLARLTIVAIRQGRAASAEPLARQVKSNDPGIRALVANMLGRTRQPISAAIPALLEALDDGDADVRANAARALGTMKEGSAVESLIKLLNDKSERVKVSAIRALAAIGDKRAIEPLLGLTKQSSVSGVSGASGLSLEIISALGSFRDLRALPFLRELRLREGAGASAELEIALARIDEKEFFAPLQEELPSGIHPILRFSAIAQGLAEIKSDLSKELLLVMWLAALQEDYAPPEILQSLAKLKPQILPFILRDSLLHDDAIVRAAAAGLIAESPEDKNLNYLTRALVKSKDDKMNDAKLAILTAISKYKSEMAIETVKTELSDSDHLVRRRTVALLKQMGAGDFSDRIGIVQTGHDKLFYQRVVAPMNRKVTATIYTARGAITMELYPQDAPITVDSFITLARKGYFNNLTFHRVVPNFVIQGGDPRGDGEGGPGYQIRCEVNTRAYGRGALGMALSGKDTGGSQFFITHSPQPHLDGGYTVFGQVTKGMEVVDQIIRGDVIKRVEISEK